MASTHSHNNLLEKQTHTTNHRRTRRRTKKRIPIPKLPTTRSNRNTIQTRLNPANTIPVQTVKEILFKWCEWAFTNNKISKEHRRPMNSQIVKAMDHAGYNQRHQKYQSDEGYSTHRVYEQIEKTDLVHFILGEMKD
jgi:hypothetical protein